MAETSGQPQSVHVSIGKIQVAREVREELLSTNAVEKLRG